MPFAVVLFLDAAADAGVREIWAALDDAGLSSLASSRGASYAPHVSLAAFDDIAIEQASGALLPVMAGCVGLDLHLASLGFFIPEPGVAFLGVVPTEKLLWSHRQVVAAVEPIVCGYRPYYLPDALVPHCTLAMHVASMAAVAKIVGAYPLPILAKAASVHLVDVLTGETLLSADGD